MQEDTPKQRKMRHFKMNRKTTVRVIVIPSSPSKYIVDFCCKTFAIFWGASNLQNLCLPALTNANPAEVEQLFTCYVDAQQTPEAWRWGCDSLSCGLGQTTIYRRFSAGWCHGLGDEFQWHIVWHWIRSLEPTGGVEPKANTQAKVKRCFQTWSLRIRKCWFNLKKKSDVGVYIAACIHLHPNPVYTPWPKKKFPVLCNRNKTWRGWCRCINLAILVLK